jgi:surfeit locus 1 family protein
MPWLLLALSAAALAVLLALGTWQVERLQWKQSLLAMIAERMAAPPVPLADVLASGGPIADQEYRRVQVAGTFRHESERHFFATFKGATGYEIMTPLLLDDGSYVFVDRGFVPYERKDPATRAEGQVDGRVEIEGLVRTPVVEKPSRLVPDNDVSKNIFYWKDLRTMAETAGLPEGAKVLGLVVDAGDAPNPGGLPVGGVTNIDLPNNHLQYAITWYGLALALIGVVAAMLLRRGRPAGRGDVGSDA